MSKVGSYIAGALQGYLVDMASFKAGVTNLGDLKDPAIAKRFDADGDGIVGFEDFFAFADNFGRDERAKLLALAHQYIGLPFATELEEVFPNPFNSSTVIRYHVAQPEEISIDVFGMTGQKVRTLVGDLQQPGIYELTWDGRNDVGSTVSTGVYFVRIQTETSASSKKLTYLK